MRPLVASLCVVTAAALAPLAGAGDDALSRADLSRLGKAATVYVENGRGSGSGFCVHPSGLFVTNGLWSRPPPGRTALWSSGSSPARSRPSYLRADF